MSFKNSRGIILAYKNEYEKQISELPKQSNFTLWFKLSKEKTGCDEDINEFSLSLCKIAQSSVIVLLPLYTWDCVYPTRK